MSGGIGVAAACAALLALTWCAYLPGLDGPLVLDDLPQLSKLLQWDGSHDGWYRLLLSESGPLKRPVAMASFLADVVLSGKQTYFLKRTNLIIHLLTGLAVFGFMRALMGFTVEKSRATVTSMALLAAAVWLLHPLHVSTVLYVVQRMTELAALFTLLGLWSYTIARSRQMAGLLAWPWMLACFALCWPLAALSKETGLLLPLFALLLEIFFFRFRSFAAGHDRCAAAILLVVTALSLSGCVYCLYHFDDLVVARYAARPFSLEERVLTEARVMLRYIAMILVPRQRDMGFVHDDLELSSGLWSPPSTLLSMLFILASLAFAFACRTRRPLVGFGIVFFFAAHLLESTLIPLEIMFEHRNYLPSVGIILAGTGLGWELRSSRRLGLSISLALILVLAFSTHVRALSWSSTESLFSQIARTHPKSKRIAQVLARYFAGQGRFESAYRILDANEDSAVAVLRLFIRCRERGRLTDDDLLHAARRLGGTVDIATAMNLMDLSNLGLDEECSFRHEAFLALLDEALKRRIAGRDDRMRLMLHRAHYLRSVGRFEEALETLDEIAPLSGGNPIGLLLSTEWLLERGELKRARERFQAVLHAEKAADPEMRPLIQRVRGLLAQASEDADPGATGTGTR